MRNRIRKYPDGKPCRLCGLPVQGKRVSPPNTGFTYPRICADCKATHRKSSNNPLWKGGARTRTNGYVYIQVWDDHLKKRRSIPEHRILWESHFGAIPKGFHVHHRNEIKDDNRIENLQLLSKSKHHSHHVKGVPKAKACGWSRQHIACISCGTAERPHFGRGWCKRCYSRNQYHWLKPQSH